jgi:Skp family chaperone for outer membrane proteins
MLVLTLFVLTAQVIAPPALDGITGAGWVGTGLLGSVLAWIFFAHIPAKDKQVAEKDRQIIALIESRDAMVKELTATHQEAIKSLVAANQDVIKSMAADFRAAVADLEKRSSEADREKRHDFNNQLQMVTNHYEKELSLTNQAIRRDLDEMGGVMGDLRKLISEMRDKNMQMWSAPETKRRPGPNPPPAPPATGR